MRKEYIFPLILILLDVGAAIAYVAGGDWKRRYIGSPLPCSTRR